MMRNKSVDPSNQSNNDIDVDISDLSAWEYLTANFDDVDFLPDLNCCDPIFAANKNIATGINDFHQGICASPPMIHASNKICTSKLLDSSHQPFDEVVKDGQMHSQGTKLHPIAIAFLNHSNYQYLVPISAVTSQERNTFLADNFACMSSTYNEHLKCSQQSTIDCTGFCHNIHNVHPLDFSSRDQSIRRSCEIVELLSNPHGMLSQYSSSGDTAKTFRRKDIHQAMAYAPPLPPHKLLKPLTAYHYFYRVERENIVQGMSANGDQIPDSVHDYSETKLRMLLDRRWYIDPIKKKRAHRKTLGKLGFENFSRIITERWQGLSKEGQQFYRRVADNDKLQYERYLQFSQKGAQPSSIL